MSVQRACDVCKMYRQNPDGTDAVLRYGLSRIFIRQDIPPALRRTRRTMRGYGGIDLCNLCWERIAEPKKRPNNGPRKRYASVADPVDGATQ